MNDVEWYWMFRFIFGAVLLSVTSLCLFLWTEASMTIEISVPVITDAVVYALAGIFWDHVIAGGIAGWIVYDDIRHGIIYPPVWKQVEPRPQFYGGKA